MHNGFFEIAMENGRKDRDIYLATTERTKYEN